MWDRDFLINVESQNWSWLYVGFDGHLENVFVQEHLPYWLILVPKVLLLEVHSFGEFNSNNSLNIAHETATGLCARKELAVFKTTYKMQVSLSRWHIMLLSTINTSVGISLTDPFSAMTAAWEHTSKGIRHKFWFWIGRWWREGPGYRSFVIEY